MCSFQRFLALMLVLTSLAVSTTTAAAQDIATDRDALDEREADLLLQLGELTAQIETHDAALVSLDAELIRLPLELELVANEVSRLVVERDAPAEVQLLVTLEAYMEGGTEADGALNDALQLRADIENVNARELYRTVVERATDDLDRIDEKLRVADSDVERVIGEIEQARQQRSDINDQRTTALAEQAAASEELARVQEAIEVFEYFSSHARLTGVPSPEINRPALVVKIDNVDAARPQSGINQADIVYEELVEGSVTRLAAVFQSQSPDVVGPVRSVRTTDIHLFAPWGEPLLANSGANAETIRILRDAQLEDVGGLSKFGDEYYRDRNRRAPHNLYVSTVNLWNRVGRQDQPPAQLQFLEVGQAPTVPTEPATGVALDYGRVEVDYSWTGQGWARSQNGTEHVDTSGQRVSPANVIVQFTVYGQSPADRRSPEAIVTGSGDAWVFTQGQLIRGTWSRPEETDVTVYEVNGETIRLTPGATWIHLIESDRATKR